MPEAAQISTWSGLIEKHGFAIVAALLLAGALAWLGKVVIGRAIENQQKIIDELKVVHTDVRELRTVLDTVLKRVNGAPRQ